MQSLLPDNRRATQDRFTLIMMVLLGLMLVHMWLTPRQEARKEAEQDKRDLLDQPVVKKADKEKEPKPRGAENEAGAETNAEPTWVTLGSMDPTTPYRMLVTLTNQGAAVARIELNDPRYRDVQKLSGYLGQIVVDEARAELSKDGVTVQVVGEGTPAGNAGIEVGDRIVQIGTVKVKKVADIRDVLAKTKPGDRIALTVERAGREQPPLAITLGRHPIDIVRPESSPHSYEEYTKLGGLRGVCFDSGDQLSFLTTLQKVDDVQLDLPDSLGNENAAVRGILARDETLDIELADVELRRAPWKLLSSDETEAVFRKTVPAWKLEITKTYRLAEKGGDQPGKQAGDGYHLTLKVEIRNLDAEEHTVAYQLDGPTGLPLEGGWYAQKSGPGWGAYGIRDIVVRFTGSQETISNSVIRFDRIKNPWRDDPLDYMGVDSRFFQCTLMRKLEPSEAAESWHAMSFPIRVGERNYDWGGLTDVSFRLLSKEFTLQPGDGPDSHLTHEYTIFAGPKNPAVLAEYGLDGTISYGWFRFVAKPMLLVLHFFHSLGLNYAMAIIALTICVRLCLFPLSRKAALGAIKMQAIQPELKEIAEKYKDDPQARMRAQNEVFKKHKYHPASGCLPMFIQLPIFIGLYKSLSVDVELYGVSLVSESVRWCNDLSAPDMLFDWSGFWDSLGWTGFNTGQGIFYLGPFFNLLPLLTIILFLIQQEVMMPPPTDEQTRMQRNMMKYMMLFMGLLFFKIPSGLCVYFIVSTLWGLTERKFIPKPAPKAANETYDVAPTVEKEKERDRKSTRRSRDESPPKKEGFFTRFFREIAEKAADQRKFEKTDKNKEKKKRR